MIGVAILGCGTIGSGVAEILMDGSDNLAKKTGAELKLVRVLDKRDFTGQVVAKYVTGDIGEILNDKSVQIVVETMGGLEPAHDFVQRALESGKHVVTSNKDMVERFGAELLGVAEKHGVSFLFEASVGGGVPVIHAEVSTLVTDKITGIEGIINGTTNYILGRMADEGLSFEDALSGAQAEGFAEKNPESDVEAHDPARKLAILLSLATGKDVDFKDIERTGISKITAKDMSAAKHFGRRIKLLIEAEISEDGKEIKARVSPTAVRADSTFAHVKGPFNAVTFRGLYAGEVTLYGMGAGKMPTAQAIISDVIEAVTAKDTVVRNWGSECIGVSSMRRGAALVRFNAEQKNAEELFGVKAENIFDLGFGECAFIVPAEKREAADNCADVVSIINVME